MGRNWPTILMLGVLVGFLAGCTAARLPEYPSKTINDYGEHKSNGGLTVSVHPMTDPQETKQYFGTNLLHSDVLAVLIVVENHNPSASYIVLRDHICLVDAGKEGHGRTRVGNNDAAIVARLVAMAAGFAVPGGGIALMPVVFSLESDAAEVRRNFAAKEWHQETISPGECKRGFAYFQLPKDHPWPMDVLLRIGLSDPIAGTTSTFDYAIHIGKN